MNPHLPVVVFSGVDQALADLLSDAPETVVEVLDRLARDEIPLVFCSSHTRAQLELVHLKIGFRHPFISENGGAAFIPQSYFGVEIPNARMMAGYRAVEFGKPYADVVDVLHRAALQLGIDVVGFRDMSIEEVAIECGMPMLHARLAKLREYSELFRVSDPDAGAHDRLARVLGAARLSCTTEGRFERVGPSVGAERAVDALRVLYRRAWGPVITVGLGESLSDARFLARMDVPLFVDNDEADLWSQLLAKVPRARVTSGGGVVGWAEAIITTLDAIKRGGRLPPSR